MIAENISKLKLELNDKAEIVVVSKYRHINDIQEVYDLGFRAFAENKVQPLLERINQLPHDIEWHIIGHLQTNKVKHIITFISMIQSVDSIKLLKEINNQAEKNNLTINCLLQIYIAQEETKFGFDKEEILNNEFLESISQFKNINIKGVMGMATNTENKTQVAAEFNELKTIFDAIKLKNIFQNFETISMGMSGDYQIAVENGSNMLRLGSIIFE